MTGNTVGFIRSAVKVVPDVPTAGAVLDRFLHHATVIAITGQSYRLKDAPSPKTKPPRTHTHDAGLALRDSPPNAQRPLSAPGLR